MTEEQAATAVARALYPSAEWENDSLAYIQCPGISQHTGDNGRRDCRLTLNDGMPPTIFCVHQSCGGAINEANRGLRSAIGKLKTSTATGNHARSGRGPVPAGNAARAAAVVAKPAQLVPPKTKVALEPRALPEPIDDGQRLHLEVCFTPDELVSVVFGAGEFGKPLNRGETVPPVPLEVDHDNGTFIRVNPMRMGGSGNADVTAHRHCLLECDVAAKELQWAAIVASNLPVSVAVDSGGKSVHAWVRVDASTPEDYRLRANEAADALEQFDGIKVDRAALNAGRLSRLAGCQRRMSDGTVTRQELLATNVGAADWDDWQAWRKGLERPPEPQPVVDETPELSTDIQFLYREWKGDFLILQQGGTNITRVDKTGLTTFCRRRGIVDPADKGAADDLFCDIITDHKIDYDGSLPGYRRGIHIEGGKRYFVRDEAALVTGVEGNWPTIRAYLEGMLIAKGGKQTPLQRFYGMLKTAREALTDALTATRRNVRPGPASVFCGPKGCGKSLLINHIITPLLGGRSVDAHKAFSENRFSGELLNGEVWVVDDKIHTTEIASRRQFASSIKSYLYSGRVGFEAKFKEPITIAPCARLFVLCNDQEEAIRVLPPLTDDIADKINLWRCYRTDSGFNTTSGVEWRAYADQIAAELPAFAYYVDSYEIPTPQRDQRNGMQCWQDGYIVALLADLTPEHHLAQLLAHAFDDGLLHTIHRATAAGIISQLAEIETMRDQFRGIHNGSSAVLGKYLGRLVGQSAKLAEMGLRIEDLGQNRGQRSWAIRSLTTLE